MIHFTAPEYRYDFFDLDQINPFFGCKLSCERLEITPMIYDYFDYQEHPSARMIIKLLTTLNNFLVTLEDDVFPKVKIDVINERMHLFENEVSHTMNTIQSYKNNSAHDQEVKLLTNCVQYCLKSIMKRIAALNKVDAEKISSFWNSSKLKDKCEGADLI